MNDSFGSTQGQAYADILRRIDALHAQAPSNPAGPAPTVNPNVETKAPPMLGMASQQGPSTFGMPSPQEITPPQAGQMLPTAVQAGPGGYAPTPVLPPDGRLPTGQNVSGMNPNGMGGYQDPFGVNYRPSDLGIPNATGVQGPSGPSYVDTLIQQLINNQGGG